MYGTIVAAVEWRRLGQAQNCIYVFAFYGHILPSGSGLLNSVHGI
eukprot:SAG31_NODE_13445_length_869_cov_0.862338_2_plen_45_part_00